MVGTGTDGGGAATGVGDISTLVEGEEGTFQENFARVRIASRTIDILGSGIVIDSGAASAVCGIPWIQSQICAPISLEPCTELFRFGDGRRYVIRGIFGLDVHIFMLGGGQAQQRMVFIECDVVLTGVALLVPKNPIQSTGAPLGFGNNRPVLKSGVSVILKECVGAHLPIPTCDSEYEFAQLHAESDV